MKIVKVYTRPVNKEYRFVDFTDAEQNIYSLDLSIFFDTTIRNNQISYKLKDAYKDIFENIFKKNPPDQSYRIEIDNGVNTTTQLIKKIIDMPYLTENLATFYNSDSIIDNFALATQKFGRFVDDKFDYMSDDRTKLFHAYSPARQHSAAIQKKQIGIIAQLKLQNMKVVTLSMKQHWRMALGLGNASVYNNGFTFHPIFGIPYIPGQSVKGILRNYVIKEHFNKKIEDAENDPVFCHYFGCSENSYDKTTHAGKLMFMDVFPTNSVQHPFTVQPDIMNPHYGDYYGDETGRIAPHDALSPVPIIFLTLRNAEFQFNFYLKESEDTNLSIFIFKSEKVNNRVGCKEYEEIFYSDYDKKNDFFDVDEPISSLIEKTLIEALEIKGVGSKTRVGYGRFIKNT